MDYLREICSECGTLQLIVNKRYCLCPECNFKRLHAGKSRQEIYKERHEKKEKKHAPIKKIPFDNSNKGNLVNELKKVFGIKKISDKKAARDKELHKVYNEIDNEREAVCEGCLRGDRILSHSHLLSQYNRPDLICDKDNIKLHCFGTVGGPDKTCHEKWSDFDCLEVMNMADFKDNLEYIREADIKVYNKIIAKFEFEKIKI